jgi:outer membrane PBP1 activator LpoA protein
MARRWPPRASGGHGASAQRRRARSNHEAIWALIAALPAEQLQPAATGAWRLDQPGPGRRRRHPGAATGRDRHLARPEPGPGRYATAIAADQAQELASQPLNKIALLLPQDGPLASVSKALREGFMAAHYQAQQAGQHPPAIEFYDSSRMASLDDFYRQGPGRRRATGRRPTGKPLVKQLSARPQLPITTLALNYSETIRSAAAVPVRPRS